MVPQISRAIRGKRPRPSRRPSSLYASGKQDRRQSLSSLNRGLIGRAPGVEKLHQLLSGTVLVPFAVTLDDFKQLMSSLGALAAGVERGRKIEARLMIERVCGDFLFELGHRAERLGLLGKIDRGLDGLDRGVAALRFRHHGQ